MNSETTIEVSQRAGWVTMACPICDAPKGARCTDSMGKPHPGEHPERRVWSTFVRADLRQSTPAVVEETLRLVKTAVDAAQAFRIAAVAAKFGDEIRPTPDLVAAVNRLFASLPPVNAVEQLKWVAAQPAAPQTDPQGEAVREAVERAIEAAAKEAEKRANPGALLGDDVVRFANTIAHQIRSLDRAAIRQQAEAQGDGA